MLDMVLHIGNITEEKKMPLWSFYSSVEIQTINKLTNSFR